VESKHAFNLFTQDQRGQRWRGVFDSLDQATRVSREIANGRRLECFVYDAKAREEVGRYFPLRRIPEQQPPRSPAERPGGLVQSPIVGYF
jgi:hypothetical protein